MPDNDIIAIISVGIALGVLLSPDWPVLTDGSTAQMTNLTALTTAWRDIETGVATLRGYVLQRNDLFPEPNASGD